MIEEMLVIRMRGIFENMKQIPDKLVVLSFDDALSSHATYVAPILRRYGFNATFFVCEFPEGVAEDGTIYPGFEDKDCYMSWEQMAALNEAGFEIGNHTLNHAPATIPGEEFRQEIDALDRRCAEHAIPLSTSFCYPGSVRSDSALPVLTDRGFRFARTDGSVPYDPAVHHPLAVPSFEAPLRKDLDRFAEMANQAKDGRISVFMIHGVPDLAHPWVSMEPEAFDAYMAYLHENGFTVISMAELSQYVDSSQAQQELTFRSANR